MTIGFVAFVVCFERARNDHRFELNEKTNILYDGRTQSCILAHVSVEQANIAHIVGPALTIGERIDLAVPKIGWIPCDVVKVERSVSDLQLRTTKEQRRRLITLLYAPGTTNIARTAQWRGMLKGLLKRCAGAH